MASLKCSKCGYGIHYHDEPNGIEWIAFELETWNGLCSSNKTVGSYETDTKAGWYTIWKCEKCGTLHIFKTMDTHIDGAFALLDTTAIHTQEGDAIDCIAFEDIAWDQITETEETGNNFEDKFEDFPRKYVRFCNDFLYVYADADFSVIERVYKLLAEKGESEM